VHTPKRSFSLTPPDLNPQRHHPARLFSIWYGATVRGDVNKIVIGEASSVGDRAVVHVAKIQGDFPTHIGNHVTIGAGALVHAATLKDAVVVGESAQVLDGAVVESFSIIAPASLVKAGTKVSSGELWAGTPAKKVRALTEEEKAKIVSMAMETSELANQHAIETAKDYQTVLEEEELADIEEYLDESAPRKPWVDMGDVKGQGHPGRIFRSTLTHPEDVKGPPTK
jgi:gamma-carbonic anhydrase